MLKLQKSPWQCKSLNQKKQVATYLNSFCNFYLGEASPMFIFPSLHLPCCITGFVCSYDHLSTTYSIFFVGGGGPRLYMWNRKILNTWQLYFGFSANTKNVVIGMCKEISTSSHYNCDHPSFLMYQNRFSY